MTAIRGDLRIRRSIAGASRFWHLDAYTRIRCLVSSMSLSSSLNVVMGLVKRDDHGHHRQGHRPNTTKSTHSLGNSCSRKKIERGT